MSPKAQPRELSGRDLPIAPKARVAVSPCELRPIRCVRVLDIIARLNVGGPAHHVSLLSGGLDPQRYRTHLLAGSPSRAEGSLEHLAERYGADLEHVDGLGPELDAAADARAMRSLIRTMREFRPHIVHTHTAKAGALGRVAARLALGPRPIVVHTFHGHVLSGYFGPGKTGIFRAMERGLAAVSDQLIGVSQATVDELVGMRIAPRSRFAAIPIGLDLDPFLASSRGDGQGFRREVGAEPDDVLAVFVGRLAPIKRVDVLLEGFAVARRGCAGLRLAIVGDGELRTDLEARAGALGIRDAVTFCGFRTDLVAITAASDIALLSSDNEGTPVALIEAAAAARPAVSTRVGGVADIVRLSTGKLVPAGDTAAFGAALLQLASHRDLRLRLGLAARTHVSERFRSGRLIRDIDDLYVELLSRRGRMPAEGRCVATPFAGA